MKHSSGRSTQSLRLSDFDHRLNMYALAASAAGVGVLALAQPTEGKIIYTKAHKTIGLKDTLHLDLNHDGIADFDLKNVRRLATYSSWDRLSAIPARRKNAVWGHTMWRAYASALSAGSWVGPKGQFLPGAGMMASTSANGGRDHPESIGNGPWANVTNRYLGLKFVIKGKIHFGWARLNVRCNNTQVTAILTGYAYETIANKPILTGREHGVAEPDVSTLISSSPATLGWLARGSKSRPGD